MTAPELVVGLDVPALQDARRLIAILRSAVSRFKVGLELFTAAGPAAVEAVQAAGAEVLLDLKLHDIPHTVAGAVRSAARLGVALLTLHLDGGETMVRAAVDAAGEAGAGLRLLGITRLTSRPESEAPAASVVDAAVRAAEWGVHGVVAAVPESPGIRAACPAGFLIVCPGIRPAGTERGDQARVATPAAAAAAECDLVVVGRPIIRAFDPLRAARALLDEIAAVAAEV